MSKRRIILALLFVIALGIPLACSLFLSYQFYLNISAVSEDCGVHQTYTPASYQAENLDVTPYLMPDFQDIRFSSRDASLNIAAFWIPADSLAVDNPAVIVVHGYSACRRSPASLLPAGMLHRAGFNVLAIDLRDVGDSDTEDGRSAAGTEEYRDVLGAWDWLLSLRFRPDRIGVFGYSLGGATTINAAGAEPAVHAIWTDSAFARIDDIIDYATRDAQWLRVFRPMGMLFGLLASGDNLYAPSPLDQMRLIGDRPLYMVHGTDDELVPYSHLSLLADAAVSGGARPQTWTTNSGHVASMIDHMDEYERRLTTFFAEALK